MVSSNRLDKTRYLKAHGWRPSTITVFGIEETAWISPRNGKVQMLKNALLTQKRWNKSLKKPKAGK